MPEDKGQDPTATEQDSAQDSTASTTTEPVKTTAQDAATTDTGSSGTMVDNELRRARDESAKFRAELREAQAALKEAQNQLKAKDDEGKSEMQKAMDRVAELEGRWQLADRNARTLRLQNEVMLQAQKLDIVDPDAAFRLLDTDNVEYDGDRPANIADLLASLIEERPYLKAQPQRTRTQASTSPTQPATQQTGKLTMDDIAAMSSAEINARWDEVKPVLASSKGR